MTDENRKRSASAEITSSPKTPDETGCRSTGLSRYTATSTAVADSCRQKTAEIVELDDRSKSPRGASTAGTARRGTLSHHHHHQQQQQQQQQHLTKAAELLKRVADKQLTGSSLSERLLIAKLHTLPTVKPETAVTDTFRELPGSERSKDAHAVAQKSSYISTDDIRTVVKPDIVAADVDEDIWNGDSARHHSAPRRPTLPIVDEIDSESQSSESQSSLSSDVNTDVPPEQHTFPFAFDPKNREVQFQQLELDSQDDSDLRIVSVKCGLFYYLSSI